MRILMTILFHILYPFRGLIQRGLGILSAVLLLSTLASFVHHRYPMAWWTLGGAVAVSLAAWGYDWILLKLQPSGTDLTLYR